MMHGILFYSFTVCVEARGFNAIIFDMHNIKPNDYFQVDVTLNIGSSSSVGACENLEGSPNSHILDKERFALLPNTIIFSDQPQICTVFEVIAK